MAASWRHIGAGRVPIMPDQAIYAIRNFGL